MLQKEINKIKFLLKKILNDLDLVDTEDFQSNFNNAKTRMILVQKTKNELINLYPIDELRKFDPELTFIAKQIQKKYDNIIATKKKQMRIIEERLKLLSNKKKLIYYNR